MKLNPTDVRRRVLRHSQLVVVRALSSSGGWRGDVLACEVAGMWERNWLKAAVARNFLKMDRLLDHPSGSLFPVIAHRRAPSRSTDGPLKRFRIAVVLKRALAKAPTISQVWSALCQRVLGIVIETEVGRKSYSRLIA